MCLTPLVIAASIASLWAFACQRITPRITDRCGTYLYAMLNLKRRIRNQHQNIHAFKRGTQARLLVVIGLSHCGPGFVQTLQFLGFAHDQDELRGGE